MEGRFVGCQSGRCEPNVVKDMQACSHTGAWNDVNEAYRGALLRHASLVCGNTCNLFKLNRTTPLCGRNCRNILADELNLFETLSHCFLFSFRLHLYALAMSIRSANSAATYHGSVDPNVEGESTIYEKRFLILKI